MLLILVHHIKSITIYYSKIQTIQSCFPRYHWNTVCKAYRLVPDVNRFDVPSTMLIISDLAIHNETPNPLPDGIAHVRRHLPCSAIKSLNQLMTWTNIIGLGSLPNNLLDVGHASSGCSIIIVNT
jgi:hypothetical protein